MLYVNECQMFVVSVNILKSAQTSVFGVYVCAYVMAEECAFHKQWKLLDTTAQVVSRFFIFLIYILLFFNS